MSVKFLLVGGGGREDAIARRLAEAGATLYAFMKNRNPSIASLTAGFRIGDETSAPEVVRYAREVGAEAAFASPDPVIAAGVSDALQDAGIRVASPSRLAAEIESSKAYMRGLLQRHSIGGSIEHHVLASEAEVRDLFRDLDFPVAVKPIGLTGGKGVRVVGEQLPDMKAAMEYALEVVTRDGKVLVERKVEGEEFSLQGFCDGSRIHFMPVVQDYKRAYEGDRGPNTGGMGSISDRDHGLPFIPPGSVERAKSIMRSVVRAMGQEGRPFKGIMYGQFMETSGGPVLIEVNARFGDPEAMNVLKVFDGDLLDTFLAIADGSLLSPPRFRTEATCLKYIVPVGYGEKPEPGTLTVDRSGMPEDFDIYYSAVSGTPERVEMSTSRSLALIATADSIPEASDKVERNLWRVSGRYYVRHDIGTKALIEGKSRRMAQVKGTGNPG
ncbi:phosphoribosylamine--glycine ligase [Thermogymnomonas acidicola]|nr:phosphoribosylamine--glycine ligase [Thermogymnomonas acidicola]